MKINKLLSLLFDTCYFFITAAICIFLFFYVSDHLAKKSSFASLLGLLAVLVGLVPIYLLYSVIDKSIAKRK